MTTRRFVLFMTSRMAPYIKPAHEALTVTPNGKHGLIILLYPRSYDLISKLYRDSSAPLPLDDIKATCNDVRTMQDHQRKAGQAPVIGQAMDRIHHPQRSLLLPLKSLLRF